MSLIRCPDCGGRISDAAPFCPACGRPMREQAPATLPRAPAGGWYEYRSRTTLFGWPLVHVLYGPGWMTGFRPARGIVAVGNIAIGLCAFGGLAIGGLAVGGLSLGLIALGGLALGLGLGLGGLATGYVALGGLAVGVYAIGGLGLGTHTLQTDPAMLRSLAGRLLDR